MQDENNDDDNDNITYNKRLQILIEFIRDTIVTAKM
jgi:hypothetical protein